MMNISLIIFLFLSICRSHEDSLNTLHGLFYDSNVTNVYYGSIDFNTGEYNLINSLNINDIGNPKDGKYSLLPLTYDPTHEIVYISAPNLQKKTIILSQINATTGQLIETFDQISNEIISLQYDIFQNQLFAHMETDDDNVTQIVELDTTNGHVKQILGKIESAQATHISSYCPICRKYFIMVLQNNHVLYIGINSSDGGGISWQTPMNFLPISIQFDYKTFTMYTIYINQTDRIQSLCGIVNRTLGGIGQILGKISDDSTILVTSHSTYDIDQKIYYTSIQSDWPYSQGIASLNFNSSNIKYNFLPFTKYSSYTWFIKQFVH